MVGQLIAFSIFSLICGALEYNFVLLVDFPVRQDSSKSNGSNIIKKPPIPRGVVVLRCISCCYTVISIVLAILIGEFLGEGPLSICMFVEVFVHLLYGLLVSILWRKYSKECHNYKKSKWL